MRKAGCKAGCTRSLAPVDKFPSNFFSTKGKVKSLPFFCLTSQFFLFLFFSKEARQQNTPGQGNLCPMQAEDRIPRTNEKFFAQKFVDTRAAICYLGRNSHA